MATRQQREMLKNYNRIVVKVGTSVVSTETGVLALGRLGNLVEDLSYAVSQGKQVLLVSSGSCGIGRHKIGHQLRMKASFREHYHGDLQHSMDNVPYQTHAAAGQSGLMAFYDMLFGQYDISIAQVLVTALDFQDERRRAGIRRTLNDLLSLKMIPVVNENDVLSVNAEMGKRDERQIFWDNDSLAQHLAQTLSADLLVLLTDVRGVYLKAPAGGPGRDRNEDPAPIPYFSGSEALDLEGQGTYSRGGMRWKLHAACEAVKGPVRHCVIASGYRPQVLRRILDGKVEGTLIGPLDASENCAEAPAALTADARAASHHLLLIGDAKRVAILNVLARLLGEHKEEILAANKNDLGAAESNKCPPGSSMYKRLVMTEEKIKTLSAGIRQVAELPAPLDQEISRTVVAEGLLLRQVTTPIGVVLIIFESRPDVLPQISSLAIRTGSGVILKGGKEARHTNNVLLGLVNQAAMEVTGNNNPVVQLVHSRKEVGALLSSSNGIDLVIPRGSKQLVKSIQQATSIPVLGHSDGVCHVYADSECDANKAVRIAVDSKTDYPAACNAMETLLLHRSLLEARPGEERPVAEQILAALQNRGVVLHAGPNAAKLVIFAKFKEQVDMAYEYSSLACTVEVVSCAKDAISHINAHGSSHTDCIVTENKECAQSFLDQVDSASVFHNASTRFADGFRYGLGAELGISTSRIHARGPVGMEGLLSTKYILTSEHEAGDVVADFSADGDKTYLHRKLPPVTETGSM
mmetsp:Transcript_26617/g.74388  ORF Transcript_26617/g.74388 Transcript_26617/m.74388 type:complete len:750 (+) Transcript_26617:140-2389(+)|eukprot:CAMPEP_0119122964 /NCGR_PEP_ID=MMETSP1310-20130426/3055_1 /TAXON_ID=464262 /ORGANISM="Genus nov. species nov., Strain RCC2339" /LENGTH=749 /DNA_ID=CAMNT_0007112699 /DNA_START=176 /DNA_END=2425 /DNA_ORIENTATION=-